jgi:F0F1-type ATP synthase membrane subunit c/vacuolar-type H+-ATPase subunit K
VDNVEWVPIIMFIGLTVVFCTLFWFRYKARSDMQSTFRAALDKGQELSPEIIDRLGHPKAPKDKDFRLGVIWIAIAVGISAFGFGIPDDDEVAGIFLGIAAFPSAIGIAYLILHKFSDRE